jgi:hypothetical protein
VVPANDVRTGWGVRGYNWEYVASVQQQLLSRLSLTFDYYRRWFGNITYTDNLAIQPSDFTPFTFKSPLNGQSITQYNVNPAFRGVTNNVVELAPNDTNVFNGFDLVLNGRTSIY